METNEVMENIGTSEPAVEAIVQDGSGCGSKVAVGFGIGILIGVTACKIAKPLIGKIKAHRRRKKKTIDVEAVEIVNGTDTTEEFMEETK